MPVSTNNSQLAFDALSGTDADQAATFDPPFCNHYTMHGCGKLGFTSLVNLDRPPAQPGLS